MLSLLSLFLCVVVVCSFAPTPNSPRSITQRLAENGNNDGGGFNPLKELSDMFSSMDDVLDDFFYKRMGNGEVFYGKRKYKPSGDVEGSYNGLGLTDKQRIEDATVIGMTRMEEKRRRDEERNAQP